MKEDVFYKFYKSCRKQLLKNKIRQLFSPCRKCKDKDLEGIVACFCTRGLFEKK